MKRRWRLWSLAWSFQPSSPSCFVSYLEGIRFPHPRVPWPSTLSPFSRHSFCQTTWSKLVPLGVILQRGHWYPTARTSTKRESQNGVLTSCMWHVSLCKLCSPRNISLVCFGQGHARLEAESSENGSGGYTWSYVLGAFDYQSFCLNNLIDSDIRRVQTMDLCDISNGLRPLKCTNASCR